METLPISRDEFSNFFLTKINCTLVFAVWKNPHEINRGIVRPYRIDVSW